MFSALISHPVVRTVGQYALASAQVAVITGGAMIMLRGAQVAGDAAMDYVLKPAYNGVASVFSDDKEAKATTVKTVKTKTGKKARKPKVAEAAVA